MIAQLFCSWTPECIALIAELMCASALGALIVHSDCLPVDYTCDIIVFLYRCYKCLYVIAFQNIVNAPIVHEIEFALLAKVITVPWMSLLITVSVIAQLITLALIA